MTEDTLYILKNRISSLKTKNESLLQKAELKPGDFIYAREIKQDALFAACKFVKILDFSNSHGMYYDEGIYPSSVYNVATLEYEGFTGFELKNWEILYIDRAEETVKISKINDFCENYCIMDCNSCNCPLKNEKK